MWQFERSRFGALSPVFKLASTSSGPVIHEDHRAFIGAQPLSIMTAVDLSRERFRNDDYRHCRIGKITMKAASSRPKPSPPGRTGGW